MKQLSKKKLKKRKDCGHWEGKFWCNCRTRNIRKWLGYKKFGAEQGENLMELNLWKQNQKPEEE